MPWRFTRDVEPYAERVLPLLRTNPAEYTVGLTVIDKLLAGHRFSDQPMLFGWLEEDGEVRGAISHNPPYDVLLLVVPDAAELVTALRAEGVAVPGVNGEGRPVERFAAAWTAGTPRSTGPCSRCGSSSSASRAARPAAAPALRGRPPRTTSGSRTNWFHASGRSSSCPGAEPESRTREQIADGRLWLWDDERRAGRRSPAAASRRTAWPGSSGSTRRPSTAAAVTAGR